MTYQPLSRDEVRSVIEGRGAASRVPVLLHLWTHAAEFGDRQPAVEALMARYPHDVQLIGVRLPGIGEAPADDPGYRWLPGGPRDAGRALDAQALIADWGELDDIVARFPDPRSPAALPENPESDGRYRLAGWWYCLFERHWSLRGMTNALTDFYTDPASVHRLYRALTDFYAGLIDRIGTELGADGVFTSDDIGMQTGPFFRETIFDEFFAPYYRELAERAHARGMHFWLHACGNIEPFIPKLIDLGLDVHPPHPEVRDGRARDRASVRRPHLRVGGVRRAAHHPVRHAGRGAGRGAPPHGHVAPARGEAAVLRGQRHQRRLPARQPRGALRRGVRVRESGGGEAFIEHRKAEKMRE